ncbi:hypothetical protein [Paracoccus sediminicola]|uniref:hypothetical protein n=1 Tax=Paracoccus sediminicola TaxID=3017783 RepID=UPI0022F09DC2|nr:hypothetical protein [Paracoccus sediminicola]WBU55635.1 hypothetical protein PAF18_08850 [Paracoccus sediminicola]
MTSALAYAGRNEDGKPRDIVEVGDVISGDRLHIVTSPGRYGLGPELPGSDYAVVDNLLIRIDDGSHEVQSIIREVRGILD